MKTRHAVVKLRCVRCRSAQEIDVSVLVDESGVIDMNHLEHILKQRKISCQSCGYISFEKISTYFPQKP